MALFYSLEDTVSKGTFQQAKQGEVELNFGQKLRVKCRKNFS